MTVRANGKITRCFAIQTADNDLIDISFPHAVRRIETARTATLTPQKLRDFRNAARVEIARQTMNYRAAALSLGARCSITGLQLTAESCAVDHHGRSFNELLFEFCRLRGVDPLKAQVNSVQGVEAWFADRALAQEWQSYHQQQAQLRLIERTANLKIPKGHKAAIEIAPSSICSAIFRSGFHGTRGGPTYLLQTFSCGLPRSMIIIGCGLSWPVV